MYRSAIQSLVVGFTVTLVILLLAGRMTQTSTAYGPGTSWDMGVYNQNTGSYYSASMNFANDNPQYGDYQFGSRDGSYMVLDASIHNFELEADLVFYINWYGAQTSCFYYEVWSISPLQLLSHNDLNCNSAYANSWHTIVLTQGVNSNGYATAYWFIDGTQYFAYQIGNTAGVGYMYDNEVPPTATMESYDDNSGDFGSSDIRGHLTVNYLTYSTYSTYFYPASWGAAQGCRVPYQYGSQGVYVGSNYEAPNNIGVTGHVRSGGSFGSPNSWGTGGDWSYYNPIYESGATSGNCQVGTQIS